MAETMLHNDDSQGGHILKGIPAQLDARRLCVPKT